MQKRLIFLVTLSLLACAAPRSVSLRSVSRLQFVGEYVLPHKMQVAGTTLGGLSGIDYSPAEKVYYLICDDRADINAMRFYTARIRVSQKGIDTIEIRQATQLLEATGLPFHNRKQNRYGVPDPEGIRYHPPTKTIVWTSEGERTTRNDTVVLTNPAVYISRRSGELVDSFHLPANLQMKATQKGPRNNGVLEGLSFTPDFKTLFVSVEEPLYEDGPRAGLFDSSAWVRILRFDAQSKEPLAQYAYEIDPIVQEPISEGLFRVNGISEILAVNDHQLLVVERSFSTGRLINNIRVYLAELTNATDVSAITSLQNNATVRPETKKLLLNMDSLRRYVENIEGISFGPKLPDGRQTLLFVADDNFASYQKNQFFLFTIE